MRFSRADRGLALTETAIVLPLLLLFLFGTMEYGWLFFNMHQVTNTAREAVRLAVRPDATDAEVTGRVSELMTASNLGSSGYTLTVTPAAVQDQDSGTELRVTIEVPYANVSLLNMAIFPVPSTLKASAAMAKEGPYNPE